MEQFLTWDVLKTYASFVSIVFMVVEFTKELKNNKENSNKILEFFYFIYPFNYNKYSYGKF